MMSIEKIIIKIRLELIEFVHECEHLEIGQTVAAMEHLSDAELLALYVESTFNVDWRGELLESFAAVSE